MKNVVTRRCWSCDKELPEVAIGNPIECCGLVHWHPGANELEIFGIEIFYVEEKRTLLYRFTPLICIAIAVWSVVFIAGHGPALQPSAWNFVVAVGFFLFEFLWISSFVHEVHRQRKKKQLPFRNNNFAKWLLVSTSATAVLSYAILSGWFPTSSNCVETRYYSCS